ncbi:MAG: helix-turn-helix domain-containing protein [Thermocrispum agreste]|uniref:Helix-turn-helix domain-containing protein n=1 Tax=Thermocrispum agreste TaxID=37925 RepID=A0ABD6FGM0_9PSEU
MAQDTGRWLYVAGSSDAPPDGSNAGDVIRWFRQERGLSQTEVAELLHTTQSRVSKIENGDILLKLDELREVAARLSIPPEHFGVLPDCSADSVPDPRQISDLQGSEWESQQAWRVVRSELNAHRVTLSDLAADLYPGFARIPGTTILTRDDWTPGEPVELADIRLTWRPDDRMPIPAITGSIEQTAHVRPLTATGARYRRYSLALRDLARPRLLDNRFGYRLLDARWSAGKGVFEFGYTCYFDVLDVHEAVAHEFADAWLRAGRRRPSFADLTLRRHVADPFDLAARPVMPSINTLTIRRDPIDGHRIYLHRRDAKSVAAAGGMYHVIPAGMFQPAALAPAHQANDFSIWRNIQREYSEEFLGNPEHDENSVDPVDYLNSDPFKSFMAARDAGDFRVFVCALVVEPLTLWIEFLTVAVIEGAVFDRLFATMVARNDEGSAVGTAAGRPTVGIPFTSDSIQRLRDEPLSPIARACLTLAWEHRHRLLGA